MFALRPGNLSYAIPSTYTFDIFVPLNEAVRRGTEFWEHNTMKWPKGKVTSIEDLPEGQGKLMHVEIWTRKTSITCSMKLEMDDKCHDGRSERLY